MKKPEWFERNFQFGISPGMLPFFIERLDGTVARLEKKLSGQPESILSFQPAKKWSIKQHVGHLAEVDEVVIRRIDEIVRGISPMAAAVFEPRHDYNTQPLSQVLDTFAKNRMTSIQKYKVLSEEECFRTSLHPRLKAMMSPVDLAYFDAEHDDHHLVKVNEILIALSH